MTLQSISADLFLFHDTCNVYVLRSGSEAVLIDFGSGDVLSELAEIGVQRVSDVLMTHHHRDQGQGLPRAIATGARVWVPHSEQDLFADVDAYWQARPIDNNYDVRQDRFSLLTAVPIAGTLRDYETRHFGDYTFTVIPTPGHTVGSISLVTEVNRQRVAFTGDLIAGVGKVWSLAATQWTYNGGEGLAASVLSLLNLKEDQQPLDYLLPSHGELMPDPAAAIQPLVDRLSQLMLSRAQNPRLFALRDKPYTAILPHLLYNITSLSNAYVLLSKSGKALFIDFGYDYTVGQAAGMDRSSRRPWLYTLPMLKRDFGVQQIDVVLPTHYHDDHVAGINLLRAVEGTQVWVADTFADVLEHPDAYNLPCLWFDPIQVDRRLPLEQPFEWEEYTLTLYPLPGHALNAVAISFEVDGTRVLATGDHYQGNTGTKYNYVYENRFQIGDYLHSAELYAQLDPQLIITGHWEPLWVEPGYFDALHERGELLDCLHRDLLPLDVVDLGGSDFVARIEPYQATVRSGGQLSVDVIVRNPFNHEMDQYAAHSDIVYVELITPPGWAVEPPQAVATLEHNAETHLKFTIYIPPDTPTNRLLHRARVAADVTIGSYHFGQHAESLITVRQAVVQAEVEKDKLRDVPQKTNPSYDRQRAY